jgi:hypothetical protein
MFTSEIVGAVLVPWSTSPTSIASQQVTDLDDVIDIHFPYVCLSSSKRVFRRVLDRTVLAKVGGNQMIVFPARSQREVGLSATCVSWLSSSGVFLSDFLKL